MKKLAHSGHVSRLRVWSDSIGCEDVVQHYETVFNADASENVEGSCKFNEITDVCNVRDAPRIA